MPLNNNISVGGTTGEFASLNVQERNEVLDAWLEAAKPLRMKLLGPSALLGHDSSIATVNNIFPTLSKDIVVSTKIGDVTKARTLQEKLNLLVDGIMSNGVKVGPPRFPQKPCDELMQARIEEHLRTFGY
ncbi:unnamed protein product, partial [Leptidea sinapis]